MRNETVNCDNCGRDLSSTTNCEDFRILLTSEHIHSRAGTVTLMAVNPPFRRDMHFCGGQCLATWVAKRYPPQVSIDG